MLHQCPFNNQELFQNSVVIIKQVQESVIAHCQVWLMLSKLAEISLKCNFSSTLLSIQTILLHSRVRVLSLTRYPSRMRTQVRYEHGLVAGPRTTDHHLPLPGQACHRTLRQARADNSNSPGSSRGRNRRTSLTTSATCWPT